MSRESTGLAPAPAIRTKRAAPPLLFPPSPPAPLPSVRRSPPPRTSVVPRAGLACAAPPPCPAYPLPRPPGSAHTAPAAPTRSEEHTSELQSRRDLVCRLLLEKKKK